MHSKIGLGGGCHWCTEAVFQSLKGVKLVEQGWIASTGLSTSFSEAVVVHYDEDEIKLNDLIQIHLETHSSFSNHSMRAKYRSAIYYFDEHEIKLIEDYLIKVQKNNEASLVTKVLPFNAFKINTENYLDYFNKNPEKAFCKRYISPKLQQLAISHTELLK